jgi:short-subunit dehydrogenase
MARESVLITGASSGIGAELAQFAAAQGHDLVLVARSRGELETLAQELTERHGNTVRVIPRDLSEPGAAQAIFDELQHAGLAVDILINNAGFGLYGAFCRSDMRNVTDLLHVNLIALTQLTRLLLPQMVARGRGRVLNVASIAAFQPGPLMAAYYASKAYVLSFSEAVANELKGSGVTMTVLCPGPTRTEFGQRAGLNLSRLSRWVPVSDAQSVARAGFEAMKRGKTLVIPGLLNRLVAFGTRFAPRGLLAVLARAVQERVA